MRLRTFFYDSWVVDGDDDRYMVAATRVVQDGPVGDTCDVGARHGDVEVANLAGWTDERSSAGVHNDEVVFFDEFFK